MADSAVLPKPAKYVTDKAGVLQDGGSALNERLKKLQDDTTAQIVVYIDKKLPANTTIEDVAVKSFRSWGVGQKGKNNGMALFVFVEDRKMRLEVGYGLEGRVPDLVAKRILDTMLKPAFKEQRYGAGVTTAVNELIRLTHAESGGKNKVDAAGSKESRHGPFGGSASLSSSSSLSASTAQSSTSSSSNSLATSSAASSASSEPSPVVEAAAGAEEPQPTGIKMLWWLLAGVLLTAGAVWAYLLNDLAKKEAKNKQAKLDRQLELERLQREEAARQRRFDAQRDSAFYQGSVLFQPVAKRADPMPLPRSTTPIIKNSAKPLAAAAAVTGVAVLTAAEVARRRRLQDEEEELARQRRRRQQEDDDESSRRSSSSSSWSSSSDSGSSSSSFDSGGGSSGGGGASSDW